MGLPAPLVKSLVLQQEIWTRGEEMMRAAQAAFLTHLDPLLLLGAFSSMRHCLETQNPWSPVHVFSTMIPSLLDNLEWRTDPSGGGPGSQLPTMFPFWATFSPSTSNLCFSLGSTSQGLPTQGPSLLCKILHLTEEIGLFLNLLCLIRPSLFIYFWGN